MSLRASLWKDNLSQVELKPPLCASSEAPLRTVIESMQHAGVGHILICDAGRIRGIFTERDLAKRVLAQRASLDEPVGMYMTPQPTVVCRSDSVGWAIRTMHDGHYRHLPVVDASGKPVGSLSVKSIVHYLVEHIPSAVYTLPPEPGTVHGAREGA